MLEQIVNYLPIILLIVSLIPIAIIFSNKENQEAEFEINIWDKFQLKLRTKKSDANP